MLGVLGVLDYIQVGVTERIEDRQLGMLLFDADNLLDVAYQKEIAEGAKEKVIFFRRKELAKWRKEVRDSL